MCSVTEDAEQTEDIGTCQLGVGRALGLTADVAPEAAKTRACPKVVLEATQRMSEDPSHPTSDPGDGQTRVVINATPKRRLVDTVFSDEFKENYSDCLGDIRLGLKATRSASDRLFRLRFEDIKLDRQHPMEASRTEKIFMLYDREPSKTTNEPLTSAVVKTSRDWGTGNFLIHHCMYPGTCISSDVVNVFVALILTFTARLRLKRLGGLIGESPPYKFCVHIDEPLTHWVTLKCRVKDKNYCIVSNDCIFMDLNYAKLWIPSWFV